MLCSYEAARAAGVADDRFVFLHAAAEAHDHWWLSEPWTLARTVAIGPHRGGALDACGPASTTSPASISTLLPVRGADGDAVDRNRRPARDDPRPLTVTGGFGFAGGR